MTSTKEQAGLSARLLATLDVLWLVGIAVYAVLDAVDVVPAISIGSYVAAVVLGVAGGAVLLGSRRYRA